jgi:hypothetical protein
MIEKLLEMVTFIHFVPKLYRENTSLIRQCFSRKRVQKFGSQDGLSVQLRSFNQRTTEPEEVTDS